jgi:hypothetical protein
VVRWILRKWAYTAEPIGVMLIRESLPGLERVLGWQANQA